MTDQTPLKTASEAPQGSLAGAVAPVATAKAPPPVPHYKRVLVTVPKGHTLPGGKPVEEPFNITVEYGCRWHPEWPTPRIVVGAFRYLSQGDSIGFTGERARTFPLPPEADALAGWHGLAMNEESEALLATAGLVVPDKRESIFLMVPRPATAFN